MMANIWEKTISILVGNLNSGLSYLIAKVFWKIVFYYFLDFNFNFHTPMKIKSEI